MTHTEMVQQRFWEAREAANKWLKENPVRMVTHKEPGYCYITVMVPSKENPEAFVKAYDIPMWGKEAWLAEKEKAGQ